MSTGSLANVVDALFDFAEYAKAQGWCSHPALEKADPPGHNHQKPITVYTADELEVLLANARGFGGLRWWVFLKTLAGTARRVGELLALQWAWLDLRHTRATALLAEGVPIHAVSALIGARECEHH